MRWSLLVLMSLSLACTKKDAAPAAPEKPAETEPAPSPEGVAWDESPASAAKTAVARPLDSPELPPELRAPAPALGAPPVLEVLEQGKEPRQALRFSVEPGSEQKVTLNVAFTIDALVVVMRVGEPIYIVSYDLTLRAGKAHSDGSMPVEFTVDAANIDMELVGDKRVSRMKLALKTARKITGSYTLGPQGRVTNVEVSLPKDATRTSHDMADNLRWALIQMNPVFPEEPLGQGAKWTVHEGLMQGGIHVNQLTTMEVVKVEGKRVELAMEQQQSAASQPFQSPGLPLTSDLRLMGGEADGTLDWDLSRLAPRSANISANVLKTIKQPTSDPKEKPIEVVVRASRALDFARD
ncbi:MAG: hypothetical protein HKP50_14495 [Myxococcales bacterium]|nr:hypothetical protein [Myxococcales bacterium]